MALPNTTDILIIGGGMMRDEGQYTVPSIRSGVLRGRPPDSRVQCCLKVNWSVDTSTGSVHALVCD